MCPLGKYEDHEMLKYDAVQIIKVKVKGKVVPLQA
jgi:hypothetical protein